MDYRTIRYLTEFYTYLNEDSFADLLFMIFRQNIFFFDEFDITKKELFITILLNQVEEVLKLRKYDIEEILLDKRKFEDYQYEYNFNEEEKKLFMYFKVKFSTIGLHEIETDETVKQWIEEHNKTLSIFQSGKNIIVPYINIIADYIEHYEINSFYGKESIYRKLLNKLIQDIVSRKRFCMLYHDRVKQIRIEHYQENKQCIIVKEYNVKCDDNYFYITDNKTCDVPVGAKTNSLIRDTDNKKFFIKNFSDHLYINNKFNKAIENFEKQQDYNFCPICNPVRLNEYHKNPNKKTKLKQMCKNCKNIFKYIKLIHGINSEGKSLTTKYIRERIKKRNSVEKDYSAAKRKEEHLKRLLSFIKEIKEINDAKKNERYNKYKKELGFLIRKQFNDIILEEEFKDLFNKLFDM